MGSERGDGGGGEVREGGEREDEKLHCQQSLPRHCMNRVVSGYLCVSFRPLQLHTPLCSNGQHNTLSGVPTGEKC